MCFWWRYYSSRWLIFASGRIVLYGISIYVFRINIIHPNPLIPLIVITVSPKENCGVVVMVILANNNIITPKKVMPSNNVIKYEVTVKMLLYYWTLSLLLIIGKKLHYAARLHCGLLQPLKKCAFCMLATKRHCVLSFVAFLHDVWMGRPSQKPWHKSSHLHTKDIFLTPK